mmetsp:Transcript_20530/g.42897  ORF Transcript_20530/g.42897 Transcript_20530/m.42897 type:complete len:240 (-) Transcript_20530:980-1699(-)
MCVWVSVCGVKDDYCLGAGSKHRATESTEQHTNKPTNHHPLIHPGGRAAIADRRAWRLRESRSPPHRRPAAAPRCVPLQRQRWRPASSHRWVRPRKRSAARRPGRSIGPPAVPPVDLRRASWPCSCRPTSRRRPRRCIVQWRCTTIAPRCIPCRCGCTGNGDWERRNRKPALSGLPAGTRLPGARRRRCCCCCCRRCLLPEKAPAARRPACTIVPGGSPPGGRLAPSSSLRRRIRTEQW